VSARTRLFLIHVCVCYSSARGALCAVWMRACTQGCVCVPRNGAHGFCLKLSASFAMCARPLPGGLCYCERKCSAQLFRQLFSFYSPSVSLALRCAPFVSEMCTAASTHTQNNASAAGRQMSAGAHCSCRPSCFALQRSYTFHSKLFANRNKTTQ
jgi:hypothetical protein